MTTKERDLALERKVSFKALRLITPESARDLGIEAEGPVFVSPVMRTSQECDECGSLFTPLVYQAGYTVKAQHFHENSDGGIYYHFSPKSSENVGYGWVAIIEPIGQVFRKDFFELARSEAARIVKIEAYCQAIWCGRKLREGLAFSYPQNSDVLAPICDLEKHPNYASEIKYNFKITDDGSVIFSQVA